MSFAYAVEHPWTIILVLLAVLALHEMIEVYRRSNAERRQWIWGTANAVIATAWTLIALYAIDLALTLHRALHELQKAAEEMPTPDLYAEVASSSGVRIVTWGIPIFSVSVAAVCWVCFLKTWKTGSAANPSCHL